MDYSKVKLFILLNLLEEKETRLVQARSKIAIKCLCVIKIVLYSESLLM